MRRLWTLTDPDPSWNVIPMISAKNVVCRWWRLRQFGKHDISESGPTEASLPQQPLSLKELMHGSTLAQADCTADGSKGGENVIIFFRRLIQEDV